MRRRDAYRKKQNPVSDLDAAVERADTSSIAE